MATSWVLCATLCSLLVNPSQAASSTPRPNSSSAIATITTTSGGSTSRPGRALHAVLTVMGVGLGLSLLLAVAFKWRGCYERLRGFRHQRLGEGNRAGGGSAEPGLAVVSGPGFVAAGGGGGGARGEDGADDGFIEDGYLDDAIFKIDSDSDVEC